MILKAFFNWVSLFERRVKLGETIGQESLTIRHSVLRVYAQFLGNLERQTLHEERGPDRVGHLLTNFEVQLNRSKNTCSGRQDGVQNTHIFLSQKIVQGDGAQGVQSRDNQDWNVKFGR